MRNFINIDIEDLIPRPIQRKIGIKTIRGNTLSKIIKQAFENCVEEVVLNKYSYNSTTGEYFIYKLNDIVEVIVNRHIENLTYTYNKSGYIKFNKPIPDNVEITIKYHKKFEDQTDSFRVYSRQYYSEPILNYIVTFFWDYLNNTPQNKITEATLITYINNYKKGENKTNGKNQSCRPSGCADLSTH